MNQTGPENARLSNSLLKDQRGFSGLETTVILIAFVTLAAIFGFAILTTGILASEQSGTTVRAGLQQATGALTLRGPVVGVSNEDRTAIELVKFQVVNAVRGSDGVDLSKFRTIVTYIDDHQVERLAPDLWTVTWLSGFGPLINPDERVEFVISLEEMGPVLGPSSRFTIQVSPDQIAPLIVQRRAPPELTKFVDLP